MELFIQSLPAVFSAVAVGLCGAIVARVRKLGDEWEILKESQRNQLKAAIVQAYERGYEREFITPMELDTVNRMADSYFALGGNHYIHAIIRKLNQEIEVKGEQIPDERSQTWTD